MIPSRRRLGLVAVLVVCALAGAWSALRIAGPATYGSDIGDVSIGVTVSPRSHGGLELYVPLADWGLRAHVMSAPVKVSVEPRRIDRSGLYDVVANGGADQLPALRAQLDDALRAAALRAVLLMLVGGLAGGALGALAWHSLGVRGRRLALAPAGALGVVVIGIAGLGAWAALTWNAERLERPTYFASGNELERLLDQADHLRQTGERYSGRVELAIRTIAGLLDDRRPALGRSDQRMLLASDIHNNILTLPALRRYGDGHPVVLAGDFTINGSRLEAGLLDGMEHLGREVIAVSGNHDSPGLMRRMARRGVKVLTHEGALDPKTGRPRGPAVVEVAGMTVAGFEDPLEYRGGDFPDGVRTAMSFGDFADGHERYVAAVEERWRWWQELPRRPQVLIVHQESLGRALANLIWHADPEGPPLAILTGHTHRQRLLRYGPVTVINGGSAGAGGLLGAGTDPVGLALLHFTSAGVLDATDLVEMDPSTAGARARRVITQRPDCDKELVICHEDPKLPDLSEPSAITAPTDPRGPASR